MNGKKIGIAVVLVIALLAFSLQAGAITHLGQKPSEHVVLVAFKGNMVGYYTVDLFFHRIYPDGYVDLQEFTVPAGFYLVVTDIEWRINWKIKLKFAYQGELRLWLHPPNSNDYVEIARHHVDLDRFGRGGRSISLTSGFVVGPSGRITGNCNPPDFQTILVRGYLILTGEQQG